jgi:hypothetical protein
MRRHLPRTAITFWLLFGLSVLAACTGSASSSPSPGVLVVQISDHREAIGDFERLDITIKRVGLHPASAPRTEGWLNLEPDMSVVDLTQVVDNPAVTILQTAAPSGLYDAVRLIVTFGEGKLKAGEVVVLPGFEDAARLVFTLQEGHTITLALDVTVESKNDHPGGGYEMHLRSVTIK